MFFILIIRDIISYIKDKQGTNKSDFTKKMAGKEKESYTALPPDPTYKLPAYQDGRGAAITAIALLIPYATVAFFVLYSLSEGGDMSLDTTIEVGGLLRMALICHGIYFVGLPFFFEMSPDAQVLFLVPKSVLPEEENKFGTVPERVDNLYWMLTCLGGELFLVTSTAFLLLASQSSAPRWTLLIPIVQCAYNTKNNLIWVVLGNTLSPINKRMKVMIPDCFMIGIWLIIYIVNYFSAPVVVVGNVA